MSGPTAVTRGLNPGPLPNHNMPGFIHHPRAPPSESQGYYSLPGYIYPVWWPYEQPPAPPSPPPSPQARSPPSVQRPAPKPERVFITYSNDSPLHLSTVLRMARHLFYQGDYFVEVDMFQRHFMAMDKTSWLDDKVENSDFIIVVCSPKYRRDVDGTGPDEDDDHGLNTRYINKAMQTVYLENKCINYKVIPVLLDGYSRETCPLWLRNTTLYRWPLDIQDIMCRLRREERYNMPGLGRRPDITVTRDFS